MKLFKINKEGQCESDVESYCESLDKVLEACTRMYEATGYKEPWVAYVAYKDKMLAGTCAFKSTPRLGKVEIAYFTFPGFEGRGVASRMVEALLEIAWSEDAGLTITAQTLPVENASNSILKKFGFHLIGTVSHPEDGEVWEWHLPPDTGKRFN